MWESLGSITPAFVWQPLPTSATGTLFRVTQSWGNQFPGLGKLEFRFDFNGLIYQQAGAVEVSSEITQLLRLPVPSNFADVGLTTRQLLCKFSDDTRIYASDPGALLVEQWTGPDGGIDGNFDIDGGEY